MVKRKIRKERSINCTLELDVKGDSLYWSVIEYYQSLGKEKARLLLLEAVRGYWGAIALLRNADFNRLELKFYLEEGIYQLTEQINFFQVQFPIGELKQCKKLKDLPIWSCQPTKFNFRYQVAIDTIEGKVMQYLMEPNSLFSKEQKVLWASLAYWGAIADRFCSQLTPEQLRISAQNCIYRLRRQIAYLKRCASLVPSYSTPEPLIHPEVLNAMEWNNEEGTGQRFDARRSMEKNYELFSKKPEEVIEEEAKEEIEKEIDFRTYNSENDELILNAFDNL